MYYFVEFETIQSIQLALHMQVTLNMKLQKSIYTIL